MSAHKPYPLKYCARHGCTNTVKAWQGKKMQRRVPKCVYDKKRFCSKSCKARAGSRGRGWVRRETKHARRCQWAGCGDLLIRKHVKSGEFESAANFKRRQHCNAEHAALAMRDRGLNGIAKAMMRRSELHAAP